MHVTIRQALSKCKIGLARGNAQVSLQACVHTHAYAHADTHAQDVYTAHTTRHTRHEHRVRGNPQAHYQ